MVRGTFANIRIRNQMAPGTEGGVTLKLPEGTEMSIFDAAMAYQAEGTPLMIIAGKEYGFGLKPRLGRQGHEAARREGRARRELRDESTAPTSWGWASCRYSSTPATAPRPTASTAPRPSRSRAWTRSIVARRFRRSTLSATRTNGEVVNFDARLRIDTPTEAEYFRHGGVLNFVLRHLAQS